MLLVALLSLTKCYCLEFGFVDTLDISSPSEWVNSIFITRKKIPAESLSVLHHPQKNLFGKYTTPTQWLIFDDDTHVATTHFVAQMGTHAARKIVARKAGWEEDVRAYVEANKADWTKNNSKAGVLYMWGYTDSLDPQTGEDSSAMLHNLLCELYTAEVTNMLSVWVITQGALVECSCPPGGMPIGTCRTVVNEMQDFALVCVDVEHGVSPVVQISHVIDVISGTVNIIFDVPILIPLQDYTVMKLS